MLSSAQPNQTVYLSNLAAARTLTCTCDQAQRHYELVRTLMECVCMLGRVSPCAHGCASARLYVSNALSAGFLPAHHGLHIGCQCKSDSLSYALPCANFSSRPCHAPVPRPRTRSLAVSFSLHLCCQMWITCLFSS